MKMNSCPNCGWASSRIICQVYDRPGFFARMNYIRCNHCLWKSRFIFGAKRNWNKEKGTFTTRNERKLESYV